MNTINTKKNDIVNLMVQIDAVLPESKVEGVDMFGRMKNPLKPKKNMRTLLDEKIRDLMQEVQASGNSFDILWDQMMGEVDDKIQEILDQDDDMFRNQEVDDVYFRYQQAEMTARGDGDTDNQGWEYREARSEVVRIYSLADEAVQRNRRMAIRLAVVAKLNKNKEQADLVQNVNDALIDELIVTMESLKKNKKLKVSAELAPYMVSNAEISEQERLIVLKDQNSHFRKELEKKAEILRTMGIISEEMIGANKTLKKRVMDVGFIRATINTARKVEMFCNRYFNGGKDHPKFRRFSYRAMCALYNEALDVLVSLNVYPTAKYRMDKVTQAPASFFIKKTQEEMVEVKSGLDWADELRSCYYESEDGTGRKSIVGSGD